MVFGYDAYLSDAGYFLIYSYFSLISQRLVAFQIDYTFELLNGVKQLLVFR